MVAHLSRLRRLRGAATAATPPRMTVGLLVALVFAALTAAPAGAAPVAPFAQCPAVGADTGCALLIYIDHAGAVSVLGDPSQGPYDTVEDTLIGVQNDSSFAIASIPVSATTGKDLFGFDGDGLCTYLAVTGCPFGSTGYEGPGVSFTDISADLTSGTVRFSPAITPKGGDAYFSLEEALATVPPFDLDTGPPAPADHMVALGDSYSAGEGLGGYLTGTDTTNNHCHRSLGAYGPLLDTDRSFGPVTFVACSGAMTADLLAPNHSNQGEPAQFDALDSGTTTVTLTIGGNDMGFGELGRECVFGRFSVFGVYGNAGCRNDKTLNAKVDARLAALDGRMNTPSPANTDIKSITALLVEAHRRAPGAFIYVGAYPAPFGTFKGECGIGSLTETGTKLHGAAKITGQDAAWLDGLAGRLNATIQRAVNTAAAQGVPAFYVNVDPFFAGHRLCDSGESWIHPVAGTYSLHTKQADIFSGTLHPTADGQKQGYEAAFLDATSTGGGF